MSLFKEKDDYIKKTFENMFNRDSDDDEHEQVNTLSGDVLKMYRHEPRNTPPKQKESSIECIVLNCTDGYSTELNQTASIENSFDGQEIITISDDEVSGQSPDENDVVTKVNQSQDLDDANYNLMLKLAGQIKIFRTTYKTKLDETLKDLMNELKSQGSSLIVTFQDRAITLEETPSSLKLSPGMILTAIEVSEKGQTMTSVRSGGISVKLQDGNRKNTRDFIISKSEPLMKLKEQYASQFGIDQIDKIKLFFDGDPVEDESTAEELDIEDDCVLDVVLN